MWVFYFYSISNGIIFALVVYFANSKARQPTLPEGRTVILFYLFFHYKLHEPLSDRSVRGLKTS